MCVCITLSSDTTEMGPRRKPSELQPVGGSGEGQLVLRPSESKDYINELSHEVLCHIFRYTALQRHISIFSLAGWDSPICVLTSAKVVMLPLQSVCWLICQQHHTKTTHWIGMIAYHCEISVNSLVL